MANTLKFGNKKWATKEDSILAYNDENNNFKPLPFDFSRASNATVVNKDGLIETVGLDEPRVDYLNDSKGALLLEPSRTNLITYSEDFSNAAWSKTNTTVISNDIISPDGTLNGSRLTDNATDGLHVLGDGTTFVSGQTYTATIFAKKGTASRVYIGAGNPATWAAKCYFDLDNGTVSLESIGNASIEDYGNGWYRCTVIGTANANASTNVLFGLANYANDETYIGSGNYAYFWGAQVEAVNYATSYIPTQGSTVTRVVDSYTQTPPDGIIGQTEGVMYLDFISNTDTISTKWLSFLGGGSQYIGIYVVNTSNVIRLEVSNTTTQATFNSSFSITKGTRYKCAIAYANNDFTAYINGVQIGIDNSGTVPSTTTLRNYYNLTNIESTIINDLQLYNTRLSNSELQALTT